MSNAEYGLDGNFTAEAILGLGGEIVFGSGDEALSSVNATDAFRMSARVGGLAVAVTVESVDIIDAVRSGDTTGAAVETGGLAGALAGAWLGGQAGSLGGWPGAILGAAVGAYLGDSGIENLISELLDETRNSDEGGDGEHENDHLPNVSPNTNVITTVTPSGNQVAYYDDPVTGLRVATTVEVDYETGGRTAVTTTVIANNNPENPAGDLLVGNTYEAGNVGVGQEISVLDQHAGTHFGGYDPNQIGVYDPNGGSWSTPTTTHYDPSEYEPDSDQDVSRFDAAPIAHLSGLSFECQGAFPAEG